MTLRQLSLIKRWLRLHPRGHEVELQAWDMVLTGWLIGLLGVPVALLLEAPQWLLPCLLAYLLPEMYSAARLRLHRRGLLRCDYQELLK
ncbi:hypothetical protein [Pelomonas sp. SE-A7]|uniref:hypothetical protein n=1 Tax=Pelomonas sp. SE-A7 TaxID=3054953 RepID=UPI00259D1B22|nr:hypothetical protein [Pelomonas sp. SE-A7]MDM4765926.1 hypothetical protein [Pelomonas sp. SE-A7]